MKLTCASTIKWKPPSSYVLHILEMVRDECALKDPYLQLSYLTSTGQHAAPLNQSEAICIELYSQFIKSIFTIFLFVHYWYKIK